MGEQMDIEFAVAKHMPELSLISPVSTASALAMRDAILMRLIVVLSFIGHAMCCALAVGVEASWMQRKQWLDKHHIKSSGFAEALLDGHGSALVADAREIR